MRNLRRAACALAFVSLVGGGLVACGDDDDDSGEETAAVETESVEEVTLIADDANGEYTFELSATPTAETKRIVFDNQGEEPHALVYAKLNEGFTVDEAFELQGRKGSAETIIDGEGAAPGQSKTIEIKKQVEPGNYVLLCPIGSPDGPHYKLGQLEEFTIE